MAFEIPGYQPPIINHVPTQADLLAAAEADQGDPGHAIPRSQVYVILRGMGYIPDQNAPEPITPRPRPSTERVEADDASAPNPYTATGNELPISYEELKRLREELAAEEREGS